MKMKKLMKKLTSIKLINWHGYYNETVEIKNNCLITGKTGSGKSTLIDAICFVISGGGMKFNKSVQDNKSSRTVETYMRGKTGYKTSGKDCLRNDSNLISHIALEFYDELEKSNFIIGCVLELREGGSKADQYYYCINGQKITNDLFYDVTGRTIKDKNSFVKDNIGDFKIDLLKGTKGRIRDSIGVRLGLENKKYLELLPKAIAFKADYSLQKMIYEFLLPEKDVDLSNIRETIREYNTYVERIKDSENRLNILSEIDKNSKIYKKSCMEETLFEILNLDKKYEKLGEMISELEKKLAKAESNGELETKNIKRIEKRKDEVKDNKRNIEMNQEFTKVKELETIIARCKADNIKYGESIKGFNNQLIIEKEIAKQLNMPLIINEAIHVDNYNIVVKRLEEYKCKLNELTNSNQRRQAILELNLTELSAKYRNLSSEKEKLEQGKPIFSDAVVNLVKAIKEEIYRIKGISIDPTPFCNLIEIRESEGEWRNAVEGYLNTKRTDIFVEEKYYDIALNVYEKQKEVKKLFGVGLVNVAKLKNIEPEEYSLSTKIISEDARAVKYANYLLGHIICVENENQLKEHESSITKTVMVYKNKAARQTKPYIWEKPLIGSKAIEIQLLKTIQELKELNEELTALKEDIYNVNMDNVISGKTNIERLLNYDNFWQLKYDNYQKMEEAINDKNALTTDDMLEKIDAVESFNKEIASLENESIESQNKKTLYDKEYGNHNNKLSTKKQEINGIKIRIDASKSDNELSVRYDDFKNKNQSIQNIDKELIELKAHIEKSRDAIIAKMNVYCNKFNFAINPSIENVNIYLNEYNKIFEYDLPKFKQKAIDALSQAQRSFQEKYIINIRKNIVDEKKNIDMLNKVLKSQPFGNLEERHQILVGKSEIREFSDYYDIFMSDQDYSSTDLFTDALSEKNKSLMDDLFARLTADNDSTKQESIIKNYIDYRNFMSYDIEISDKYGHKMYHSESIGGKSGGETQNPFYVILAAAFNQISSYENRGRSKASACLVFLDEAFDKMDASRVKSMIEYFDMLKIQVMIAVPDSKAKDIFSGIDTKIAVVKTNNNLVKIRTQITE